MDWKIFVLHNEVHYREILEKSVDNSKIYDHVGSIGTRQCPTNIEVVDMKTLDAALKYREGKLVY